MSGLFDSHRGHRYVVREVIRANLAADSWVTYFLFVGSGLLPEWSGWLVLLLICAHLIGVTRAQLGSLTVARGYLAVAAAGTKISRALKAGGNPMPNSLPAQAVTLLLWTSMTRAPEHGTRLLRELAA